MEISIFENVGNAQCKKEGHFILQQKKKLLYIIAPDT